MATTDADLDQPTPGRSSTAVDRVAAATVGATAVRPATWRDRAAVADLVAQLGGHEDAPAGPGWDSWYGEAIEHPDHRLLVATPAGADAHVVGYLHLVARSLLTAGTREGWIAGVAVADGARSRGAGAALIVAARRHAAVLGCDVLTVESSTHRAAAHRFYRAQGFVDHRPARRFVAPVDGVAPSGGGPADDGRIEQRFLRAAACACAAVRGVLAGYRDVGAVADGADGAPTTGADRAAEQAAAAALAPLGLPILSEESGLVGDAIDPDESWISLDPLDGTRNYRHGSAPYATAIGLVRRGMPLAGLVADHTTGHRWWAWAGGGAYRDGRAIRCRAGGLAATPSPGVGQAAQALPDGHERLRMTGSTAVDLCRVADGSFGCFDGSARPVVHVHDLAGPLAVLREAGAQVVRADGSPLVLVPDARVTLPVVATGR